MDVKHGVKLTQKKSTSPLDNRNNKKLQKKRRKGRKPKEKADYSVGDISPATHSDTVDAFVPDDNEIENEQAVDTRTGFESDSAVQKDIALMPKIIPKISYQKYQDTDRPFTAVDTSFSPVNSQQRCDSQISELPLENSSPQAVTNDAKNKPLTKEGGNTTVNSKVTLPSITSGSRSTNKTKETFNESLRWEYALDDSDKEEERIKIYKMNRRKRYWAFSRKLNLTGSSSPSWLKSASSTSVKSASPSASRERLVSDVRTPSASRERLIPDVMVAHKPAGPTEIVMNYV